MGNLARTWYEELSPRRSAQDKHSAPELENIARDLLNNVAAAGVAIAHEQADPETLVCVVSVGRCAPPTGARLDPNSGISGRTIRERRTQKSYDTELDPRVDRAACERLGIRSLAVAPLIAGSRCIGLIEAVSDRLGHFDEAKIAAIERAADAAVAWFESQSLSEQPEAAPLRPVSCFEEVGELQTDQQEFSANPPGGSAEATQTAFDRNEIPPSSRSHLAGILWTALVVALVLVAIAGARFFRPTSSRHGPTANDIMPETTTAAAAPVQPLEQPAPSAAPTPPAQLATASHFELLAQRAAKGDVASQVDLAQAYLTGDAVPQDSAKAASWLIMAGENGSAKAKRRSIELTRDAALFQIAEIRFDLGKMYMNGIGAKKNYVSAYMWFELARAAGDIRVASEESSLETKMEPSQMREARKRASEWLKSHLRKGKRSMTSTDNTPSGGLIGKPASRPR